MRARVRTKTCQRRKHGHAVIEIALMGPWLLLLFLAVFNFGFFMYAGMSVANAARAAALEMGRQNSTNLDRTLACAIAKDELKSLPNNAIFLNPAFTCNAAPLCVDVGNVGGACTGTVGSAITDFDGVPAVRVRVVYQSVQLFPLPWLAGRMNLTRRAEIRAYE